jgi:predicted nucleic acid-binding Zn ribbon protein
MTEREPAPLGNLLRTLVSGRGWDERLAFGRLRTDWAGIVGPALGARSEPVRLAKGVLTVRAEHPWATELALLGRSLARKADAHLGGGLVSEVRVVAGP